MSEDKRAYVTLSMSCSEGEISCFATLDCTFDQIAAALASAYDSQSFVTVQVHPDHRMHVTRRRETSRT